MNDKKTWIILPTHIHPDLCSSLLSDETLPGASVRFFGAPKECLFFLLIPFHQEYLSIHLRCRTVYNKAVMAASESSHIIRIHFRFHPSPTHSALKRNIFLPFCWKWSRPHFPNVVILCCLSCSSSSFSHQRLRPLCPKHLSGILYTMYAMTLGWEWDQRRTTMDDTSSCPNWILLRILQHCDAMIITRTVDAFTIPTGRHQCQSKRMDMKGIKSGGQRTHQLWIPWNIVAGQDGFARDIPVLQWLSGCQFFQSRSFWWSEEMRSFLFLQKSSHVMSFHPIYFPQFLLISCFI